MCHGKLDITSIERAHKIQFDDYFAAEKPRVQSLAEDGLIDLGTRSIALTPRGRLLMRNVAMAFDAYLAKKASQAPQSRAI